MGYEYKTERAALFTEEGQRDFLKVRDRVKELLKQSGAVRSQEATQGIGGSSWFQLACLDRLVELDELREAVNPVTNWAQHRIFVSPYTS